MAAMNRLTSGTVISSRSGLRLAGSASPDGALFGALLGMAADHGEVGQGEHGQGDVAVPPDPRSHLILVQPHLALGLLEQAFWD